MTQGRELCNGSEHKVDPSSLLPCCRLLGHHCSGACILGGETKVNLTALPGPQVGPWRGPEENGAGEGRQGGRGLRWQVVSGGAS